MKAPVFRLIFSVAVAAGFAGMGCEEPSDDVPQQVLEQQARREAAEKNLPKIPTTQELMTGPRTTAALGPLPLTLKLPPSWAVNVKTGATLLEGYTPSGTQVAIQLTSRPTLKKDALDAMIRGAKKEQAEKPQSILKVELRPLGDALVYERQAVGAPAPYPQLDHTGQERTTMEQLFKWTISVLAPHGEAFQHYELNFIGLTKSQYEQDKEFLHGILDTLAYRGGGARDGGSTTGATTTPGAAASPPTLP